MAGHALATLTNKGLQKVLGRKRNRFERTLGRAGTGAATGATIGSIVPGVGTLAGGIVGGGIGAISGLFSGGGNEQPPALDQLTPERQAFEDAALVSLRQSGQLAGARGQAQGQAFASAGLAGSPLATSQIANQRRLADQSALDRITSARFGLESGIAGREFQQSVLDQQQSQFDRSQRNAFIAIGAEIGFDLLDDFGLFDELSGLIDFGELFGTNDVSAIETGVGEGASSLAQVLGERNEFAGVSIGF